VSFDLGMVAFLIPAAVLAGLLIGVLPVWRQMMSGGRRLPVWLFLRRQRASLDSRAALDAEIRCAVCGERAACQEHLKAGSAQPPESCPNAALFESGRSDQNFLRNASRSAGRMPAA
jgi:hypothetical protein